MPEIKAVASKLHRDRARHLRRDQTDAESKLWAALAAVVSAISFIAGVIIAGGSIG